MLERFTHSRSQEQAFRGAEKRLGRTVVVSAIGNVSLGAGIVAVASGKVIEGTVATVAGAGIQLHEHIVNLRRGR